MSAFAGELKRFRKLRVLTQQELSDAALVPVRTISDLERGVSRQPHPDTVRKLASALGLTGAELAGFLAAARADAHGRGEQPPDSAPDARTPVPIGAVTRTLPRDIGSFTGRERELEQLLGGAQPAAMAGIRVIDGMAGIGKTAFAVHAAHQLREHFPDGQIFMDLRGHAPGQAPVDPADALSSLLQTVVGVDARQIPHGTQERARLWRDRLADRRLLLLLDDAADSEQVQPLLPGTAGCLVLVTSRRRLTALEDVQVISLDTLSPAEAAALFARLASRPGLSPSDAAVAEISELCGYLPLAIGILAARLRHHKAWTAAWLAADLAAARNRRELMRAENRSVSAAFMLSYNGLGRDEQQLFRRLGIYPGTDVDAYAAAALDGTDLSTGRHRLEALYDQHLIGEPTPGRYRMHDLIREHASDLAGIDAPAERDAAIGRLLDYYVHAARAADRHLAKRMPSAKPERGSPAGARAVSTRQEATEWMEAERLNLHAAAADALLSRPAITAAISAAMSAFLCAQGYWDQARVLGQTALEAARRTRDKRTQATALANLSVVYRLTADFAAAIASDQRALRLCRASGDRTGEGDALTRLGRLHYLTGNLPEAVASLSRALELYSGTGDLAGEADALIHLGHVQQVTGDSPSAAHSLSRARELCRALGDQAGEADVLYGQGTMQYETGQYQESIDSLTHALGLFRLIGNRNDEAWALNGLGASQLPTGALDCATVNLTQALKLFRTLGNQYGEATALNNLGIAQRLRGDHDSAVAAQEQSRRLYRVHDSQHGEANALREIGVLQHLAGDSLSASASLARALEISRVIKDRLGEAQAHNNMGDLLLSSDPVKAQVSYGQAALICDIITAPLEEARALEGTGRCLLLNGQPDQAVAPLRQAMKIYRDLGAPGAQRVEAILQDHHRESRPSQQAGHA